jgi:NAD(P)-dependent dehydrogenase (short-subunit alcohol dehydrogenase family)
MAADRAASASGAPPVYALHGKTALVIGAAVCIGQAIALEFGRAGAAVVCADVNGDGAVATAKAITGAGSRAIGRRTDVTRLDDMRADVAAAVETYGGLDVLMFGAAVREPSATVVDLAEADWNRLMAVNLGGAFLASKAALPAMIARGGGSVIFIASQLGRVGGAARPAYCAAKGALINLAKAMAIDHASQGIRVNTLSPGPVETERLVHRHGDLATARAKLGPKNPIGRLGLPEEIARAAVYLASDASAFMTGSDLLIDGGYTAI